MRKVQKDSIIELTNLLQKAQEHVKNLLLQQGYASVLDLLQQCQQGAIQIGTIIEQSEGEGFATVKMLEEYCEYVFQLFEMVQDCMSRADGDTKTLPNADVIFGAMDRLLAEIEESIKRDIEVRKEVVFLPYKASMWDSLESIWMAADADPECDAYVVPIPYYEKDPEGNLKVYHYEGDDFPEYVPITKYDEYDFELNHPNMIFIHNPYDEANYVTSVHPFFYSYNIKKYTDTLVYVPYFAIAGGMGEGQRMCSAYRYADYIVIQAERHRGFFDKSLPQEKLIAFGTPKYDRVMRICQNPPEPPEEWGKLMKDKKVYFFNTSISGLLGGTATFLMKMNYVFECFRNSKDACLIWRPHPLLESTLRSMRKEFLPYYLGLKKYFLEQKIGIYDETPDITNTIALCDAYVGDAGTSVTSLFGIAGKPMFILDNYIRTMPNPEDLYGQIIKAIYPYTDSRYMVAQGNKLYFASNGDYKFRFLCKLTNYAYGDYYRYIVTIRNRQYICPCSAHDILVMENNQIIEKIKLDNKWGKPIGFRDAIAYKDYLLLIPFNYPCVVKYNTRTKEIQYISEHMDCYLTDSGGEKCVGGYCVYKGYLFLGSPVDNKVVAIQIENGEVSVLTTQSENQKGCYYMASDEKEIWILPYQGYTITKWNPMTGVMREYPIELDGLTCRHYVHGCNCEQYPFSSLAFTTEMVYLARGWGNSYVCLDKNTGEAHVWEVPFENTEEMKSGYFTSARQMCSCFLDNSSNPVLISYNDRKLYRLSLEDGGCEELEIKFDEEELLSNEPGFCEYSEWLQYACVENYYNTLPDFLCGTTVGEAFDADRQRKAFEKNAANSDGTCGEKLYEYLKQQK